jgi:hypothetical protein
VDGVLRERERLAHESPHALELYRQACARAGVEVPFNIVRVGDLVRAYDPVMQCTQIGFVESTGCGYIGLNRKGVPDYGELGIWSFREELGDTIVILNCCSEQA